MASTKGITTVKATKYTAALKKARTKVGDSMVVGYVGIKNAKDFGKKGMKTWRVVAHKRKR